MLPILTFFCFIACFGWANAQNFPTAMESVVALNFSGPYMTYYEPGSQGFNSMKNYYFQSMSYYFLQSYNLVLYDLSISVWPLNTYLQATFTFFSRTYQDSNSVYNLLAPYFQSAFAKISVNTTINSLYAQSITGYSGNSTAQSLTINVYLSCQLFGLWDQNYLNSLNPQYTAFYNLFSQDLNGYVAQYGMSVQNININGLWYNNWGTTFKFNLLSSVPQTNLGLISAVQNVASSTINYYTYCGYYWYQMYSWYTYYCNYNSTTITYMGSPRKYPVWYVASYQSQFTAHITAAIQIFSYFSWSSTNTNDPANQPLRTFVAAYLRYGIQQSIPGNVSVTSFDVQPATMAANVLFIATTNGSYDYYEMLYRQYNFRDPFNGFVYGTITCSNFYVQTFTSGNSSAVAFYGVPGETQFAWACSGYFLYPTNDTGFSNFLNSKAQSVSLPVGVRYKTTVIQYTWPVSYNITANIAVQSDILMDAVTAQNILQNATQSWLTFNTLMLLNLNNFQMSNYSGIAPIQYGEAVYAIKVNWCFNAPYKNTYSDPNSVDSLTFQQDSLVKFINKIPQIFGTGARVSKTTKMGLGSSTTPC